MSTSVASTAPVWQGPRLSWLLLSAVFLLVGLGALLFASVTRLWMAAALSLVFGSTCWGAAALCLLGAWRPFLLRYVFAEDALRVSWLWQCVEVPYSTIDRISGDVSVASVLAPVLLSQLGYLVGTGRGPEPPRYFASAVEADQLMMIVSNRVRLVVSPARLPEFREELVRRLEADGERTRTGGRSAVEAEKLPLPMFCVLVGATVGCWMGLLLYAVNANAFGESRLNLVIGAAVLLANAILVAMLNGLNKLERGVLLVTSLLVQALLFVAVYRGGA